MFGTHCYMQIPSSVGSLPTCLVLFLQTCRAYLLWFGLSFRSFQLFVDVNFTSLSEITILGIPCSLKISFINISTMLMALKVDFIGMKCANLLSLSITTMIESVCFWVFGKPLINSSEMVSHFHYGIGNGCNRPAGCWCSALTCWQSWHLAKYSYVSPFILGQKNSFLSDVIVFW